MNGGDDGLNPRPVVRDPCVDSEFPLLAAPLTEGRDAVNVPAKMTISKS